MSGFLLAHAGFSALSFHMPILSHAVLVFVLPSFIQAESVHEFALLECRYSH